MSRKKQWRLIPLLEAEGVVQMAIDTWLLEQHRNHFHPPTLRFYTWSKAAISLGYHQRQYPSYWSELTWQGKPIDLVRRPTGGRAVLHQGDLTYMVVTSGIPGTRTQAYEFICDFLIDGWRSLGVNLHYGSSKRGYIHNPSCFATATGADLVTDGGDKVIGSAQLRKGKAILQHGSMVLSRDRELFSQVFGEPASENIESIIKQQGEHLIPTVVKALTEAASHCFGIDFVEQSLSDAEWQEVLALI